MNTTESICIRGIGWLNEEAWGRLLCDEGETCAVPHAALWKQGQVLATPVKNSGRFDTATRLTMVAVALALGDGGRCGVESAGPGTGLLGGSRAGSAATNRSYFQDYLQAGRTLARGNLFIYTLPSSPLAEVAIHFGFTGPMFYAGFTGGAIYNLLATARTMLREGTPEVIAIHAGESDAIAFWMGPGGAASAPVLTLDQVAVREEADQPVAQLAGRLRRALKGNGTVCA